MVYSIKADPVKAIHQTNSSSYSGEMYVECTNRENVRVNSCDRVILNAMSAHAADIFMSVRLNKDNVVHEIIQTKNVRQPVSHEQYLTERYKARYLILTMQLWRIYFLQWPCEG